MVSNKEHGVSARAEHSVPSPQKQQLSLALLYSHRSNWIYRGQRDFPRMPFLPPPAVPHQRAGQLGPKAGLLPASLGLSPLPPTCQLQNQMARAVGALMSAWGYLESEGHKSVKQHRDCRLFPVLWRTFPTEHHATTAAACWRFPSRRQSATSGDSPDLNHEVPK